MSHDPFNLFIDNKMERRSGSSPRPEWLFSPGEDVQYEPSLDHSKFFGKPACADVPTICENNPTSFSAFAESIPELENYREIPLKLDCLNGGGELTTLAPGATAPQLALEPC